MGSRRGALHALLGFESAALLPLLCFVWMPDRARASLVWLLKMGHALRAVGFGCVWLFRLMDGLMRGCVVVLLCSVCYFGVFCYEEQLSLCVRCGEGVVLHGSRSEWMMGVVTVSWNIPR